jgi:hypothetical protein
VWKTSGFRFNGGRVNVLLNRIPAQGNLFAFFGWKFKRTKIDLKQFSSPEKWGIIYIRPHFWDDVLFDFIKTNFH